MDHKKEYLHAASLWAGYVSAKLNLLDAGFIRSYKAPETDFAEWIVAITWNGELPDNLSNPAYDVVAGDIRIQVKSIAKMQDNPNGYIITNKDRDNDPQYGATHYAFVFFDDLIPTEIFLAPESFVRTFKKKQIKRSDLAKVGFKADVDLSDFKKMIEQT